MIAAAIDRSSQTTWGSHTMTLGDIVGHLALGFFACVALGIILSAVLEKKKAKKAAPSTTVARITPAPTRPAERVYTADEVRAFAEEYHHRRVQQRPRNQVRFEDGWYDETTGEIIED